MKICLVDFETNGFDPKENRATEFGALLLSTDDYSAPPGISHLLYDEGYPEQSDTIVDVTGITTEMLLEYGIPFAYALSQMIAMFEEHGWPEYFLAHNASFDRSFFQSEMKRCKPTLLQAYTQEQMEHLFGLKWLCSIQDIHHPDKFKCKKLSHLALDYGMPIDPSTLHRAFDDVTLLACMLEKMKVSWQSVVDRFHKPWLVVRAMIPQPWDDDGVGKAMAASCGFRWQDLGDLNFPKMWVKKIKAEDIISEKEKLGYEITIIKEIL
jgi:DNA polymerase III epsilon subunit-like protein